jgi:hypothetical protein
MPEGNMILFVLAYLGGVLSVVSPMSALSSAERTRFAKPVLPNSTRRASTMPRSSPRPNRIGQSVRNEDGCCKGPQPTCRLRTVPELWPE